MSFQFGLVPKQIFNAKSFLLNNAPISFLQYILEQYGLIQICFDPIERHGINTSCLYQSFIKYNESQMSGPLISEKHHNQHHSHQPILQKIAYTELLCQL